MDFLITVGNMQRANGQYKEMFEYHLSADGMFEPLKATIELLKTYGEELSDEVHQQLQVCT